MKNHRQITATLLVLAGALSASGCDRAGSATAKATATLPIKAFNGSIIDFKCDDCTHAHYEVGDTITVTQSPRSDRVYHFRSEKKKTNEVNESELAYCDGFLRGTTEFSHSNGGKEKHWLILVPRENMPWEITTCDEDPHEGANCTDEQHAGYGHADD